MQRDGEEERVRLIDFDSGFPEDDPPLDPRSIQGDPAYLAPETFLCMSAQPAKLTRKLDTFAFGLIAHRLWTGSLPEWEPGFDYAYQAALNKRPIRVSPSLPPPVRWLVSRALAADPAARPDDGLLERLLAPRRTPAHIGASAPDGLNRYLLPEWHCDPDAENG